MNDDPYSRARYIRYSLSAWGLLFIAILFALVPWIGSLLTLAVCVYGIMSVGKIASYGFWRQPLLLVACYTFILILSLFAAIANYTYARNTKSTNDVINTIRDRVPTNNQQNSRNDE